MDADMDTESKVQRYFIKVFMKVTKIKDNQNGRRPKRKKTKNESELKMEDDQKGRQQKQKTNKREDDQNRRRPEWKSIKMEDDKNGRRKKWKASKMDDDLIQSGSRPHPKLKMTSKIKTT